jgi:hypothetical protein
MVGRIFLVLIVLELCALRAQPLLASTGASVPNPKNAAIRKFYPVCFKYRREVEKRIRSDFWRGTAFVSDAARTIPQAELVEAAAFSQSFSGSRLYELRRLLL